LDEVLLDELGPGASFPMKMTRVPVLLAVSDNGPQIPPGPPRPGTRIAQHFGRPGTALWRSGVIYFPEGPKGLSRNGCARSHSARWMSG
jgi:hypothetical protein